MKDQLFLQRIDVIVFMPGGNGGMRNKEKSRHIGEVLLTKCELVWKIRNGEPGHREKVSTQLPHFLKELY